MFARFSITSRLNGNGEYLRNEHENLATLLETTKGPYASKNFTNFTAENRTFIFTNPS